MISICRKAFFYKQFKLGNSSFFEVPIGNNILIVYSCACCCAMSRKQFIFNLLPHTASQADNFADMYRLCFLFIAVTTWRKRGIHCDHWFSWGQCKSNSLNTVLENGGGSRGRAEQVIRALGNGFASINTATKQTYSVALTPAPWRATSSSISCSTAIRI